MPIVAAHKCPAVALAMDEKGIPKTKEERISIIGRMLGETRNLGIPDGNLYFDPLAMTIATGNENGLVFFDTIREIRKQFPEVHMTCGLSNISFGMPARSFINRVFLALCHGSGTGLRHLRSEQSGHQNHDVGSRAFVGTGQALPQIHSRISRGSF